MNIEQTAALVVGFGAVVVVAGIWLQFGLPGALIFVGALMMVSGLLVIGAIR